VNAVRTSSRAGSEMSNGPGAAAILSAGAGCFVLALLALAVDESAWVKGMLNFYKPTGPLSGVTTTAILVWLCLWMFLEWRWGKRTVAVGAICAAAFLLLFLGLALTFPPIVNLF
jgi:hypothetical protein